MRHNKAWPAEVDTGFAKKDMRGQSAFCRRVTHSRFPLSGIMR